MKVVSISHPPVRSVKGRGLACRKLSKPARALLGVDIIEGTTNITDLSHRQVAATVGVSIAYLSAALRLAPAEREAVRRGLRPLVEPRWSRGFRRHSRRPASGSTRSSLRSASTQS
jgi:hypothetical protein